MADDLKATIDDLQQRVIALEKVVIGQAQNVEELDEQLRRLAVETTGNVQALEEPAAAVVDLTTPDALEQIEDDAFHQA